MTKERRLGIIEVQASDFCDSCLPYPEKVIHQVHKNLPVVAAKRNEDLLNIIKVFIFEIIIIEITFKKPVQVNRVVRL